MNLREEKGYTMVAVIVTVVILSIMITAVSTLALSDVRKSKLWRDKTAAFYLAESGINDALFRIINQESLAYGTYDPANPVNPTYTSTNPPDGGSNSARYDFGPGNYYEVWVEKLETEGKLKITSKGIWNKVFKVIQQKVELPSVFPLPVALPPYAVIETELGRPYYDPEYISPEIKVSPPPGNPSALVISDDETINGNKHYSGISVSKNHTTLTINGPATISIAGSVIFNNNIDVITNGDVTFNIAGDLTFVQNSNLKSNGGQVNFFVGQNAVFEGNYLGNTIGLADSDQQDPTKLVVYLSTEPDPLTYSLTIHKDCNFAGGICAPKALVSVFQNDKIDALVGYRITFGEQGEVSYDPRMDSITLPGGTWSLKEWSEY